MSDTLFPTGAADDAIREADRLCFFSHYDADGRIDDYVLHYLRELRAAGFVVLFVTTAVLAPGEARRVDGLCAQVVERENVGLDFGGWIECLARFPDIRPELLLLCNDSVYGPFWSLSAFIAELTSVPADAYGAVRNLNGIPHLQSWFLLLRPSAYESTPFRALMSAPVPAQMSKIEIIARYEMVLTKALTDAGLRCRAAFDPEQMGPVLAATPLDPTHMLWRELLTERLVPFVKIAVLRQRPSTVLGLRHWRAVTDSLNPALGAAAADNLKRRLTRYTPFRGGVLREFVDWPTLPLAQLPVSHGVLAREVRDRAAEPRHNRTFAAAEALYDVLRAPYGWAYRKFNEARKRQRL